MQQFNNPANPEIHQKTTGTEIWQDTDGEIAAVVAGVSTGGTIISIVPYLKKKAGGEAIKMIAVESAASPIISQTLAGLEIKPGPHKIQGIGAGFIPDNLDLVLIDDVFAISDDEAIQTARLIMQKEGILADISSDAAVATAAKLAFQNKNIVVILPSSGERYLSTDLFSGANAS